MLRFLGTVLASVLLLLLSLVLLLVLVLTPGAPGLTLFSGQASGNASTVVTAARALQARLYGPRANQYTLSGDALMQQAYNFWVASCGSNGTICPEAVSGNLQCVEFVTATEYLAGNTLPAIGNGADFWPLYQNRAGWQRIAVMGVSTSQRGLPQPGDLMVWQGGAFGHVAVVIAVIPPTSGRDGSVTVAQANAPGNHWSWLDANHPDPRPDNWYRMPLHADLSISTWTGYSVLGYLRRVMTGA